MVSERTGGQCWTVEGRTEGTTNVPVVSQRRFPQSIREAFPGPGRTSVPDPFSGQRAVLEAAGGNRKQAFILKDSEEAELRRRASRRVHTTAEP